MIRFEEALAIVLDSKARSLHEADHSVEASCFRGVARDYVSDKIVPPFANSAVDGFAVVSSQTLLASKQDPLNLTIQGSIAAGDSPPSPGKLIGAWEIAAGAPYPVGFDATIRMDDAVVTRDDRENAVSIEIHAPVSSGHCLRAPGEDFNIGTPLLQRGSVFLPEHVLAFSSLGISEIRTFKKPKVVVISTGKELVPPEALLLPGQIRNSTAPFLKVALTNLGVSATFYCTGSDDPSEFIQLISEVLKESPDIIISTGGASSGRQDFVTPALVNLGANIRFQEISMRPGKPNLFAQFKKGPAFFGLPGNPVSTVVGLRFLVEPYIRQFMARAQETPLRAQLRDDVKKPEGLRCFFKAKLEMSQGLPQVTILNHQDSFLIRPLLEGNVWAVLPEVGHLFPEKTWVDVYPIYSSYYDWSGLGTFN